MFYNAFIMTYITWNQSITYLYILYNAAPFTLHFCQLNSTNGLLTSLNTYCINYIIKSFLGLTFRWIYAINYWFKHPSLPKFLFESEVILWGERKQFFILNNNEEPELSMMLCDFHVYVSILWWPIETGVLPICWSDSLFSVLTLTPGVTACLLCFWQGNICVLK